MHITSTFCHSSHPGATFRTQPRAHAQRGALVGGVAGAGGQSQPAGADLQAAGRPVWTCADLQRLGERLWQTALGAAWSGPGYTWSPSGESSRVQRVHCRLSCVTVVLVDLFDQILPVGPPWTEQLTPGSLKKICVQLSFSHNLIYRIKLQTGQFYSDMLSKVLTKSDK